MVMPADAARWARGLDEVVGRIAPRFARPEPRRRAGAYLRGPLASDGLQDFLSWMRWDVEAVRNDLQAHVAEHLGDEGAVLVLTRPAS